MPKRPISKLLIYDADTLDTTSASQTLFTSEAAETLIRLVGNLTYKPGSGSGTCIIVLHRRQKGVSERTVNLTNAQPFFEPAGDVLWHQVITNTASGLESVQVPIDAKGMRKMQIGDRIDWTYISSSANGGTVAIALSKFAKQ